MDMASKESTEAMIARIDERTQAILKYIEGNAGAISSVKAHCSTVSGAINARLKQIEANQTGRLTGREKAIVYAAGVTGFFALLVTVVETYFALH
jgi:hypothetical protein